MFTNDRFELDNALGGGGGGIRAGVGALTNTQQTYDREIHHKSSYLPKQNEHGNWRVHDGRGYKIRIDEIIEEDGNIYLRGTVVGHYHVTSEGMLQVLADVGQEDVSGWYTYVPVEGGDPVTQLVKLDRLVDPSVALAIGVVVRVHGELLNGVSLPHKAPILLDELVTDERVIVYLLTYLFRRSKLDSNGKPLNDGSRIQRITLDSHVSALVDLWKRQKRAATDQVHELLARQDPRAVAKPLVDMHIKELSTKPNSKRDSLLKFIAGGEEGLPPQMLESIMSLNFFAEMKDANPKYRRDDGKELFMRAIIAFMVSGTLRSFNALQQNVLRQRIVCFQAHEGDWSKRKGVVFGLHHSKATQDDSSEFLILPHVKPLMCALLSLAIYMCHLDITGKAPCVDYGDESAVDFAKLFPGASTYDAWTYRSLLNRMKAMFCYLGLTITCHVTHLLRMWLPVQSHTSDRIAPTPKEQNKHGGWKDSLNVKDTVYDPKTSFATALFQSGSDADDSQFYRSWLCANHEPPRVLLDLFFPDERKHLNEQHATYSSDPRIAPLIVNRMEVLDFYATILINGICALYVDFLNASHFLIHLNAVRSTEFRDYLKFFRDTQQTTENEVKTKEKNSTIVTLAHLPLFAKMASESFAETLRGTVDSSSYQENDPSTSSIGLGNKNYDTAPLDISCQMNMEDDDKEKNSCGDSTVVATGDTTVSWDPKDSATWVNASCILDEDLKGFLQHSKYDPSYNENFQKLYEQYTNGVSMLSPSIRDLQVYLGSSRTGKYSPWTSRVFLGTKFNATRKNMSIHNGVNKFIDQMESSPSSGAEAALLNTPWIQPIWNHDECGTSLLFRQLDHDGDLQTSTWSLRIDLSNGAENRGIVHVLNLLCESLNEKTNQLSGDSRKGKARVIRKGVTRVVRYFQQLRRAFRAKSVAAQSRKKADSPQTPVNKRGIGRGRGNRPNRAKSPRTCAAACVSSRSAGYTAKSDHASLAPRSLSSDMGAEGGAGSQRQAFPDAQQSEGETQRATARLSQSQSAYAPPAHAALGSQHLSRPQSTSLRSQPGCEASSPPGSNHPSSQQVRPSIIVQPAHQQEPRWFDALIPNGFHYLNSCSSTAPWNMRRSQIVIYKLAPDRVVTGSIYPKNREKMQRGMEHTAVNASLISLALPTCTYDVIIDPKQYGSVWIAMEADVSPRACCIEGGCKNPAMSLGNTHFCIICNRGPLHALCNQTLTGQETIFACSTSCFQRYTTHI